MVDMFALVCIWQASGWGTPVMIYERIFEGIVLRMVSAKLVLVGLWGIVPSIPIPDCTLVKP